MDALRHVLRAVLVLFCVAAGAGCGTMLARVGGAQASYPVDSYKSVNGDLLLMGLRSGESGTGNPEAVLCWMMVVCPLVAAASLPLDAVVDTVLWPVDTLASP